MTELTADEARHRLYEIMKDDRPFAEKAERALALGTSYLGVDSGFVTRIDTEEDRWETIATTGGMVPTGAVKDLGGTLCRHTLERDSPLALHDATQQGWSEDSAVRDGGIECYHGTTLSVDGETYGTVCFVSATPRAEPFDEAETMFAELVGRLLEHELEYRSQRRDLERQTNQINVLDRVLRHNIRNDMSVIRARAQLLSETYDDCEECEAILRKADELVNLSETARELGTIVNGEFERQEVDVVALLDRLVTEIRTEYPAATITLDVPPEATLSAMSPLQTALRELLENAAKHGTDPSITASVTATDEHVRIRVTDDGPGLPQTEQEVLDTGTETPLVHGSGLGLWTVHWIVTGHHGETDVTSTDEGTTVTVTLPRTVPGEDAPSRTVRRAHDRYEAVFEDAADPMVILNDNGRLIDANANAATLFGEPERSLVGRHLREFLPDESDFESLWRQFRASTDHARFELVRDDRTHRSVEYASTLDIVPGQHLAILHEVDGHDTLVDDA